MRALVVSAVVISCSACGTLVPTQDCKILCGDGFTCPDELYCDAEGFCRKGTVTQSCRDAGTGGSDAGPQDAGTVVNTADNCSLLAQDCDAGYACMRIHAGNSLPAQCASGTCDVVSQVGCAAALKCGYSSFGGTVSYRGCLNNGSKLEDTSCGASGQDDCIKGTTCVQFSSGSSMCARYCTFDSNCGSNKRCSRVLTISGTSEAPTVCTAEPPACDLLTQVACTGTDGCFLTLATDGGAPAACFLAGFSKNGSACASTSQCYRGSVCVGALPNGTCRQICAADGGVPECKTGTCSPLSSVPGAGVCQ